MKLVLIHFPCFVIERSQTSESIENSASTLPISIPISFRESPFDSHPCNCTTIPSADRPSFSLDSSNSLQFYWCDSAQRLIHQLSCTAKLVQARPLLRSDRCHSFEESSLSWQSAAKDGSSGQKLSHLSCKCNARQRAQLSWDSVAIRGRGSSFWSNQCHRLSQGQRITLRGSSSGALHWLCQSKV